ncbi:hypothetical protein IW262DRAFT_1068208 [Armillaria fumosa]|nr:hypothetical protein IW262DRAFT_1068208 [Armillaria fumosa]
MSLCGHSAWLAMSGLWARPFLIGTLCRYQYQYQYLVFDDLYPSPCREHPCHMSWLQVRIIQGSMWDLWPPPCKDNPQVWVPAVLDANSL